MVHEVVQDVLAIEEAAVVLQQEAQAKAERLVAEARVAAVALRERNREEARRAADERLAAGKEAADAECARILDAARAEAEAFEHHAESRLDAAVAYVVVRVAGQPRGRE